MAVTVDQLWIYRFHDQLQLTYQQKGSLLENTIAPEMVHRDVHAAIDHFERLGNVIANDVVVPFGQTNILNPVNSRRAVTLQSSDAAVLVSDEHSLRSMVNPQNGYVNTMVYALGRRADLHIINAAVGSSQVAAVTAGSGVITYSTQPLPSASKGTGSGVGGAVSLANIIAAGVRLSKMAVPLGPTERIMLYSPGQEQDIMAITQASSSDFTKNRIHDSGTVNGIDWEGFHWIMIADVVDPTGTVLQRMLPLPTPTTRKMIAFHRGAIGLAIGRAATPPMINERPDLNNSIQVRQVMMMAAVRVWDTAVFEITVLEN